MRKNVCMKNQVKSIKCMVIVIFIFNAHLQTFEHLCLFFHWQPVMEATFTKKTKMRLSKIHIANLTLLQLISDEQNVMLLSNSTTFGGNGDVWFIRHSNHG